MHIKTIILPNSYFIASFVIAMERLTTEIKNHMVALKTAGKSLRKIMQQLNVKKTTICSV